MHRPRRQSGQQTAAFRKPPGLTRLTSAEPHAYDSAWLRRDPPRVGPERPALSWSQTHRDPDWPTIRQTKGASPHGPRLPRQRAKFRAFRPPQRRHFESSAFQSVKGQLRRLGLRAQGFGSASRRHRERQPCHARDRFGPAENSTPVDHGILTTSAPLSTPIDVARSRTLLASTGTKDEAPRRFTSSETKPGTLWAGNPPRYSSVGL